MCVERVVALEIGLVYTTEHSAIQGALTNPLTVCLSLPRE